MSGPNGGQCEPCPVGTFSFNATNFNWDTPRYTHCDQPYSWRELIYEYKDNKVPTKSGGPNQLLDLGGYETRVCINHHICGDPYFCWE